MVDWLPSQYTDTRSYFSDILSFLFKYKWIYNWSVKHILIENAVFNVPPDWLSALGSLSESELNNLYLGRFEVDWPESLQLFLSDCQKFQLSIKNDDSRPTMPSAIMKIRKGLSPKKEHEVLRLAALINAECSKANAKFVVDIGSGLGYLCEILHLEYGYDILGLESDPKRTTSAIERHNELQKSVNIETSGTVSYRTCYLSEDSVQDLEQILLEVGGSSSTNVCMVGLHPCGDLTSSAMHLFNQINQIKLLILLPCCYHRKALKSSCEEEESFFNFPLSDPLSEAVAVVEERTGSKGTQYLRRPLLRLAAQRASGAWEQVGEKYPKERVFNTLATASVYLLAHREKSTLKKKKRRPVRRSQMTSLDNFLSDAVDRYEFISSTSEDGTRMTKLRQLVDDHEPYLRHIGILLALQGTLQPVAEGLVLADYIAKLNTLGYEKSRLLRLTDPLLSPRGVALISSKEDPGNKDRTSGKG